MHTLQMIQTIRWIISLFNSDVQRALFTYEMIHDAERIKDASLAAGYLKATHELTRITDTIIQNPYAVEVLSAFGLKPLTEKEFGANLAIGVVTEGGRAIQELIAPLLFPWRLMTSCVAPVERLTIPSELTSEEVSEDIITLTIQHREAEAPSLDKTATALESLESAYLSIAKIYGMEEQAGHLHIIKIESGSAVRVDCKGLGLVVKHLKEFFIEAWHKFRHKRSEEVIENNRAALSTVSAVQQIEASVQNGTMSREQGEILKRRMIEETLGLFGSGALIIEIPQHEVLDNTKLLREFGTKLLMAPKNTELSSKSESANENHIQADIPVAVSSDIVTPPTSRRSGKKSTSKKQGKRTQKSK